MNLTIKILKEKNACTEGINWFLEHKLKTVEENIDQLMKEDKFNWANWLLSRLLDRKDKIRYTIFAAESVLNIFEKKYPNDKRPRNAILAAKNYLENPTEENKKATTAAAAAAAYAADVAYAVALKKSIIEYGLKLLNE